MSNQEDDDSQIKAENLEQVGNLVDAYTALDAQPVSGEIQEASTDLKASLSSFVQHYIQRIQGHKNFEDILKEVLIERLPDADFEQIEKLLNTTMRNSNNGVEKIMAPFTQKDSGGVGDTNNTFLFDIAPKAPVEDKMLKDDSMSPEILKGMYDLAQFINAINTEKKK